MKKPANTPPALPNAFENRTKTETAPRERETETHDPHGPGTNPAGPNELGRMPTAPVMDQSALHHEQAEAEERAGNGAQERPAADEVFEHDSESTQD